MIKTFLIVFFLSGIALACPKIEGQFGCRAKGSTNPKYDFFWLVTYDPVGPTYIVQGLGYVWKIIADGQERTETDFYDMKSVTTCSGIDTIVADTVYLKSGQIMGNGRRTLTFSGQTLVGHHLLTQLNGNVIEENWSCEKLD